MKCNQCPKPAMYFVTARNIPLCLSCFSVFSQLQHDALEESERMLNFLSDQITSAVGIPPMGPRFPPRPKPVQVSEVKLDNINVSNSVVGTINTGSIGAVDQTISALVHLGETEIAQAIKQLTEAALSSPNLDQEKKNEILEILGTVATEAATPTNTRRSSVAKVLLARAKEITSVAKDISEVCQRCWPILAAAFKVVSG